MASPPEVTIKDLSGNWVMNKSLSDDTDAMLTLQGVGWWTRKAISLATVYLAIKHYTGEDGQTHIDIDSTATGGIKGTQELRILDWAPRQHDDHVFGTLTGQSRWTLLPDEVPTDDPFFREGWLEGEEEKGGPNGETKIESFVVNEERGWNTRQIWGFAVVEGERYWVRRVVAWKGEEVRRVRLVYNFSGR